MGVLSIPQGLRTGGEQAENRRKIASGVSGSAPGNQESVEDMPRALWYDGERGDTAVMDVRFKCHGAEDYLQTEVNNQIEIRRVHRVHASETPGVRCALGCG